MYPPTPPKLFQSIEVHIVSSKPSLFGKVRLMARLHDQVFLDNFSLPRSYAQKLVMPALEKGDLSRKTWLLIFRAENVDII